jgi:hypothetical protein
VRMVWKAGPGLDGIVVPDPQFAPAFTAGIMIVCEGESGAWRSASHGRHRRVC